MKVRAKAPKAAKKPKAAAKAPAAPKPASPGDIRALVKALPATTRMRRTFEAVGQAHYAATLDARGAELPMAKDAAKILEALHTAILRGGKEGAAALREGTKWARTVSSGGRAPMSELVRTLSDIVKRGGQLWPFDAAVKVVVSGLFECGDDPKHLALRIAERADKRRMNGDADPELDVKTILRAAGMSEAEAGNAVHAARL